MDTQLEQIPPDGPATLPPPLPQAAGFAYDAQTETGQRLSGVIEATDAKSALLHLQLLRLRVTEVEPAKKTPRAKSIRGDAFYAFNQQLAQLTKSGLPIEQGLRLIATDMKRGRLAATIRLVADELDSGVPLGEAFEKHRRQFPALYGRLVDAGVRSGNLPSVLLNLGRHIELHEKLRASLWRTASYPLMVFVGLMFVIAFVGVAVLPQFRTIFSGFRLPLPAVTEALLWCADIMPGVLIVCAIAAAVGSLAWVILRGTDRYRAAMERVSLGLPLVGPVLRLNLIARWLNAVRIAVDAGMDLPSAISMAGDATGSPRLGKDGNALNKALEAGQPLTTSATVLLPATVLTAITFASENNDLPPTLTSLSDLYQGLAAVRLDRVPAVLTPALMLFIATLVGFVIAGILMPLIGLVRALTGH
ncbi:MAG: pilC [Phycisphaerales bacterium]|nr:pilC [Phycisphaerales bacterium]